MYGSGSGLTAIQPDGQTITVESAALTGCRLSGRIDGVPFSRIAYVVRAPSHWRVHLQTPAGMTATDLRTLEDQHLTLRSDILRSQNSFAKEVKLPAKS